MPKPLGASKIYDEEMYLPCNRWAELLFQKSIAELESGSLKKWKASRGAALP